MVGVSGCGRGAWRVRVLQCPIQLEMSSGLGLGFGFYWLLGACAFFYRFLAFFFSSEILEDLIHGSNKA